MIRNILFYICFGLLAMFFEKANASESYAQFSKRFQCPESLPSDEAREASLKEVLMWLQQKNGSVTIRSAVNIRVKLLEEHHCEETLSKIRSNSDSSAEPDAYLCSAKDGRKSFVKTSLPNCSKVYGEPGWKLYSVSPEIIVYVLSSKMVMETDGTKLWTQYKFAHEVVNGPGGSKYDTLKSITKYFCRSKQQLLIQGTYSLSGQPVYERSAAESVMEEIEPGTIAEGIFKSVCQK